MREIRKYGSAGGVAGNGHPYPDNQSSGMGQSGTAPFGQWSEIHGFRIPRFLERLTSFVGYGLQTAERWDKSRRDLAVPERLVRTLAPPIRA
jgi:hypothetical protein